MYLNCDIKLVVVGLVEEKFLDPTVSSYRNKQRSLYMKKTLLKRHEEEVNGRIPASVYSSIRRSACVTVLMSSSGAVSWTASSCL